MHTDNATEMSIEQSAAKWAAINGSCAPETQATLDAMWAALKTHQQGSNVNRDFLGNSCEVAPIIRMDKVMCEVMERVARRIARDMIKYQCAYEINLLVAAEYCKNGDWEKSVAYGEQMIDQMLDEAMEAVLGGK